MNCTPKTSLKTGLKITAAIAGVLTAGSLAWAGAAAATPLSGSSADDVVNQLKAEGYSVQLNLNSTRDVPLYECTVSGVHGLPRNGQLGGGQAPAGQLTTVYVDVDCPPDN